MLQFIYFILFVFCLFVSLFFENTEIKIAQTALLKASYETLTYNTSRNNM